MGERMFNADDFARRIRVRIAERGINAKDCAAETGISPSSICRITQGKSPDVENYLRLTAWLDRTTQQRETR